MFLRVHLECWLLPLQGGVHRVPVPSVSSTFCASHKLKITTASLVTRSLFLFLAGGFSKFQAEFALHCETNLDGSCSSSSPPLPVLGLGGLRISSDSSSDIESDLDRDPNSATDSDGSPLSNSQPSFPVEILPFLYLGCAKDSTNLDVLEEFGIKYILNVTPNLPNLFENAGEFKYKQIPISDHWSQNLSQFFPEAISFIGETNLQSFIRVEDVNLFACKLFCWAAGLSCFGSVNSGLTSRLKGKQGPLTKQIRGTI